MDTEAKRTTRNEGSAASSQRTLLLVVAVGCLVAGFLLGRSTFLKMSATGKVADDTTASATSSESVQGTSDGYNQRLEDTAKAFTKSADECLYAVRDHQKKYQTEPNCVALDALSSLYIEAGGALKSTPDKFEREFKEGLRVAWTALAMSETGNTHLRIW